MSRSIPTTVLMISLLSLLNLVACGSTAEEDMLRAQTYIEEGKIDGAGVLYRNILDKDPTSRLARLGLARVYALSRKPGKALEEFEALRPFTPEEVPLYIEAGMVSLQNGNAALAIDYAVECLDKATNPELKADAKYLLGLAQTQQNAPDQAIAAYREALELNPEHIKASLELANVYVMQSELDEGMALARGVLDKDPKNTTAMRILGDAYHLQDNDEEALAFYSSAFEIDPGQRDPAYKAGLLSIDMGRLDLATKVANSLSKAYPKWPGGEMLRAMISIRKNELDEAEQHIAKALRLGGDTEALFISGYILSRKGRLETALSDFHRVLGVKPSYVPARLLVADIYLRQNRLEEAQREAKKVLDLDPDNSKAYLVLGTALVSSGKLDEGLEALEKASAKGPDSLQANFRRGLTLAKQERLPEAFSALSAAVDSDPGDLRARLLLFSVQLREGKVAEARETLTSGLNGSEKDAVLYYSMGALDLQQRKIEDSKANLAKAIMSDPNFPAPYFILANIHFNEGNPGEAVATLKTLIANNPKEIKAYLYLYNALRLDKKEEEAADILTQLTALEVPEAFLVAASACAGWGEHQKALELITELEAKTETTPQILELKSRIQFDLKDTEAALATLETLEAMDQKRGIAGKIQLHMANNDPDKALAATDEFIAMQSDSLDGYQLQSQVAERLGRIDIAFKAVHNALAKDQENVNSIIQLANLHAKSNEYTEALRHYERVIELAPKDPRPWFYKGVIYELLKQSEEAEKVYLKALELRSDYQLALNNLAMLYLRDETKYDKALEIAFRAFMLNRENPGVLDTLGYALLLNGKNEQALNALEAAALRLPSNPSVLYHLAKAYHRSGKPEKAMEPLKKALSVKIDFQEREAAQTLLSELESRQQ